MAGSRVADVFAVAHKGALVDAGIIISSLGVFV